MIINLPMHGAYLSAIAVTNISESFTHKMHGGKNQPLAMLVVVHFQSPRHVDSKICATNFAQSLATPFNCDESLDFFSDDFVAANLLCIPDLKVKQLLKNKFVMGQSMQVWRGAFFTSNAGYFLALPCMMPQHDARKKASIGFDKAEVDPCIYSIHVCMLVCTYITGAAASLCTPVVYLTFFLLARRYASAGISCSPASVSVCVCH